MDIIGFILTSLVFLLFMIGIIKAVLAFDWHNFIKQESWFSVDAEFREGQVGLYAVVGFLLGAIGIYQSYPQPIQAMAYIILLVLAFIYWIIPRES